MRKAYILVRILLLCVLAGALPIEPAWGAKIKDDPNGFNGNTWGADLAAYPSMKLVKDLGSTDFVEEAGVYMNSGESLTLNEVSFTEIRYRFIDKQLESIELKYEGRENRDKLMRWIEEQFGKLSSHERKMVMNVQWFGEKTTITLSYNPNTKLGSLWFISQVLNHRFNEFLPTTQGD